MSVTLKDIAQAAEVSITTVSRVVNRDPFLSVSPKTEERVWHFVRKMGYPVQKPRVGNQKIGSDKRIGFIQTITQERPEETFFAKIVHGIEQEAYQNGLKVAFAFNAMDFQRDTVKESVLSSGTDGIILVGKMHEDIYSSVARYIPHRVSIFEVPDDRNISCVLIDSQRSCYKIVKKMIALGHKNIGFLGGPTEGFYPGRPFTDLFDNWDDRLQGYEKALLESGIRVDSNLIRNGNWTMEGGYQETKNLLEEFPELTAIFSANDGMAIGSMRAVAESGKKIPRDFSIAGFDNIEMSRFTHPPLTTIDYPKEEIGRIAIQELINSMKSGERSADIRCKKLLMSDVVERDTIGPAQQQQ